MTNEEAMTVLRGLLDRAKKHHTTKRAKMQRMLDAGKTPSTSMRTDVERAEYTVQQATAAVDHLYELLESPTAEAVHWCSYDCDRPACIRAQRDELRGRLEAITAAQQPDHIVDATKMVAQQQGQAVATVQLNPMRGKDDPHKIAYLDADLPVGTNLYAQQPAAVDELPDCPHSALDGCDCYATQNQGSPMTAETDLLPCRCGNTNLHVAHFLGACRVVCRRCEEQTSYSRNHVDMWNRKMKRGSEGRGQAI